MQETSARHRNIFTKKYPACKGKSKKAKEARLSLEKLKLQHRFNNAKSLVMNDLIMKEIKELSKGGKTLSSNDLDNIKIKVKDKVKNKIIKMV